MHELAIAKEIIEVVEREIGRRHITGVTAVGIRLGALSAVDPEALTFSFEAGTRDTRLEGARLLIEPVAVALLCRDCGREFSGNDIVFLCPGCDSSDVRMVRGDELYLDHIECE